MDVTLTVSQLNRYVKSRLEEDFRLKDILLSGEISNLNQHYRSGHIYFVLKDAAASVRAVMFRSNAELLRFALCDGMRVLVRCSVSLYERDGSFQVYAREIYPDGAGALNLAFEQRKQKLEREGLFEAAHKRPLPRYPGRVGVVTSLSGAALQDIIQILARRYPLCRLVVSPATVQGEGAEASLLLALRRLRGAGCDVVILGRGGGSLEDLWAFNSEALAREIYGFPVPVVSAVGHETDYTICDFVADARAPTPSAAAELVAPDCRELRSLLDSAAASLDAAVRGRLSAAGERLRVLDRQVRTLSPQARIQAGARRLAACGDTVSRAMGRIQREKRERLAAAARLADSLSPLRTMERGYSVLVGQGGRAVRSVAETQAGDELRALLADGELRVQVRQAQRRAGGAPAL